MSLQGIVQQGTGELAGSAPIAPDVTPARPRRFGLIGEVLLRLSAGLVLLFLFAPIFVIVLFSFNKPQGKFNLTWQRFSLDAWTDPFRYPELTKAMRNSLETVSYTHLDVYKRQVRSLAGPAIDLLANSERLIEGWIDTLSLIHI